MILCNLCTCRSNIDIEIKGKKHIGDKYRMMNLVNIMQFISQISLVSLKYGSSYHEESTRISFF